MAKGKNFEFTYGTPQGAASVPTQRDDHNLSESISSAKAELAKPPENKASTQNNKAAKVETDNTKSATSSKDPEIKITGQLTMQPKQKKKKDKAVNFLVPESEYQEFTQICKKLGYSYNEVVNYLLSEFIKANKL